jgi:hypothetical protein
MSLVAYKKPSNNLFLLPNNKIVDKPIKYDVCKSSDDNLRANGIDPKKFMAAWNQWKASIILNELGITMDMQEGGGWMSMLATIATGVAVLLVGDMQETKIMGESINPDLFSSREQACKVYTENNVRGLGAVGRWVGLTNNPVGKLKTSDECTAIKLEIKNAETDRRERAEKSKAPIYKYGIAGALAVGATVKAIETYIKKKQKYTKQIKQIKAKITELEKKQQEQYDLVKAHITRISELVKSPLENAARQRAEIETAEEAAVKHEENAEKIFKEITKLADTIVQLEAAMDEAEEELDKSQEAAVAKIFTLGGEALSDVMRDNIEYTRQQAQRARNLAIIHMNAATAAKAQQIEWLKVAGAAGVAGVAALSGGATVTGALAAAVVPTTTATISAYTASQTIQQGKRAALLKGNLYAPPPPAPLNVDAIATKAYTKAAANAKAIANAKAAEAKAVANAKAAEAKAKADAEAAAEAKAAANRASLASGPAPQIVIPAPAPTLAHGRSNSTMAVRGGPAATAPIRYVSARTGTARGVRNRSGLARLGVLPSTSGGGITNRDIANALSLELIASDVRADVINIIVDKISSIKGANALELMNANAPKGGKRNMTRRSNRKN